MAYAEVTEPNGVAVPLSSTNGETQLSTLFMQRGEAIDFVVDGLPMPDTFSPLCGFKATLVLKQSGSSLAVGWYNADSARTTAPAASEIYELVPAGSPVPTSVTGADIRKDPNYQGGAIGFALVRTPPSFSEARYNTVCSLCSTPGPWILSVSYKSTLTPNAYYVAFEDGNTSAVTWSNDGDFNDYVFLFEGLSCVGEGASCDVPGAKGVCLPGILECSAGGTLTCVGVNAPSAEVCDGQDNDCNGVADDGAELCGSSKVCSRGQCVPRCGTGEFTCGSLPFTQCENGLCVDPACAGKTCADGEACIAGQCRAPCDGVTCPAGQSCRLGQCVDPCKGVSCDSEHVCSGGGCILRCDCNGCAQGLACDTSGLCVEQGCVGKSCAAGTVCMQGQCVDACKDASCPSGSHCEAGQCVQSTDADAGVAKDAGAPGQSLRADAAVGTVSSGSGADAAVNRKLGGGATTGGVGSSGRRGDSSTSGCGCVMAGRKPEPGPWPPALLGLVLVALRFTKKGPSSRARTARSSS